jgi:hypothetical protein
MNRQYNSIEQLFTENKDWIQGKLNSHPFYYNVVRRLGFKEIGISIVDARDNEKSRYASHNGLNGKIDEIVNYFEKPDITVKTKERVLLDIIENYGWVEEHPIKAFVKYKNGFSMPTKDLWKLGCALLTFSKKG